MLNQVVLLGEFREKLDGGFVIDVDGQDIFIEDTKDLLSNVSVRLGNTIAIKGSIRSAAKLGYDLFEQYNSVVVLERVSVLSGY
jgi:hypothetical protein